MSDRVKCCWTNCENEQGSGTWTQITTSDGPFTLPVCEEHWFGNWQKRTTLPPRWRRQLAGIEADCKVRNWDSYHADPVDQRAIDAAQRLCQSLMVFPTKNGGVTVNLAGEDVAIELTDEGQLEDFYLSITDVNRFLLPSESVGADPAESVRASDDSGSPQ
jgi:hypothetical protein